MGDVRVISPEGKSGTVPEEDLPDALGQGYTRDTPELQRERQLEAQYGDRPLESGALGVLRGATFGLSDVAARETGLYTPDELSQLQTRNRGASTVGEVGSLLLPGGALGAVAKAGKVVAGAVRGGTVAAKVGRAAVQGAVEGGFFGAGHAVSESVLSGEPELNGEKLAAGALSGALGGAAGLGALTGAGAAAKAGARKAFPLIAAKLDEVAIAQGRRVLTGGADSLSGKAALSDDAVRLALEEGAITPLGTTASASEKLSALKGKAREEYNRIVSELEAKGVEGPEAGELADKWLRRSLDEGATSLGSPVPDFFMRGAEEVGAKAGASGKLGLGQAEAVKRSLQRQAKYGRFEDTMLNEARQEVASDLRQAIEDTVAKAGRESADEGVKGLAESFVPAKQRLGKLIEADKTAFKGAEQESRRRFFSLSDNLMGAGALASGHPGALVAPLLNNLARNYGTSAVAAGAFKLSRTMKRVATAFEKEVAAKLKDSPSLFGAYQELLAGASAKGADNLLRTHVVLAQSDAGYRDTMAAAGFAPESPEESEDIHARATRLGALEETLGQYDKEADLAIGRFLGKQSGAAPKPKHDGRPRAERLDSLKASVERLAELAAQPGGTFLPGEALTSAAPATAAAAVATATKALQFLGAAAPKNPNASPLPALQEAWKPTDGELAKWERYVEAVESPYAVVHRLREGAIHPDSVQALQAVYPKLLEDVRRRMMERLAAYDGTLTYTQKLALSALMGQPMGTAGDAGKLRVLQQAHAAAQTAKAQQKAAAKAKPPEGLATLSQRVEAK